MARPCNVVDSSAWLEFFAAGPNAEIFAQPIEGLDNLVVPTIAILEVYKRLLDQKGASVARESVALMRQGQVVPLDEELALASAELSLESGLSLADSVILATARRHEALLWTMDSHFDGIGSVRYVRRLP